MKKLLTYLCLALALTACKDKQEQADNKVNDIQAQISMPADPDKLYSYQKDNLPETCESDNEIVCAIENVVKCALNPTASYCDKKTMPEFLFYDDSMFAEGDVLGRPSEQSFKITKIKPLDNQTIEVFTKGQCDKNWFGVCEGNVIYVMTKQFGTWQVQDVYAIETIK